MPGWLDRMKSRRPPQPLRGSPTVARVKHYSALSGYAYEYLYEGYHDRADERVHVFRLSGDRKTWFALSVHVPGEALRTWEEAHGRTLGGSERYAVAKLALFAAFDQRPNPREMRAAVSVDAAQVEALLASIDI
jgi:hypothetical protein